MTEAIVITLAVLGSGMLGLTIGIFVTLWLGRPPPRPIGPIVAGAYKAGALFGLDAARDHLAMGDEPDMQAAFDKWMDEFRPGASS